MSKITPVNIYALTIVPPNIRPMFLGDDPGTGVRRIAAAAGIIFPLVC
jgi:hypothetical protein